MRAPRLLLLCALAACGRTDVYEPGVLTAPMDAGETRDAGPPRRCGDDLLDPPEACDDGNTVNTDACLASCAKARCGDGFVWAGVELCDDGNTSDTDGCTTRCAPAACGDGVRQPPEQCDDRNADEGDDCLNACTLAQCGDGRLRIGIERCDDGNVRNDDACVSGCLPARCGDGFVQRGVEPCDDGNGFSDDACLPSCVQARCGDGITWRGVEQCDDANSDDGDACLARCTAARCGDGVVRRGVEACDDGNTDEGDACRNICVPARCGDGVVQRGVEQCDDGNSFDDDACGNDCRLPVCGDGEREGTEACDLGTQNGNVPAFLISQPSGTRIGTNPIVRRLDAVRFYDYRSASSHTGFEQVGESRIYLYVDSNTGRLSLVLTHGIDAAPGMLQPQSTVEMDVTGLPTGVTIDVTDDDPTEFFRSGPTSATGRWSFNQNSDGAVLGGFPFPGTWRVTVAARFMAGINTWGWVRDDLQRIPLVRTEPITIEAFAQSAMCRPTCTVPRCGDRILDGGEVCDDGNTVDGDGCSANCRALR